MVFKERGGIFPQKFTNLYLRGKSVVDEVSDQVIYKESRDIATSGFFF